MGTGDELEDRVVHGERETIDRGGHPAQAHVSGLFQSSRCAHPLSAMLAAFFPAYCAVHGRLMCFWDG